MKCTWLLWPWLVPALPWLLPAQNASFTLSTATAVVGASAGAATVQLVASPPGSPWTATSNATWLHLGPSSASGTGSTLVQFSYDANPNSAAQTGTLTIAGQTLTVTQAGSSFAPLSTITTLISQGLNRPYGVAVDSSGNLYIADTGNNAIREWVASTQQMTTLVSTGLNSPHGVAVDGQGNVYIADAYNNAVEEWSPSTQQFTTLVSSGLNFPLAVAVDGQGNVYIADFGNNAIKQWSPISQQVITLVGSGLSNPTGVGVDALGNVYIADFRHNAIEQWSPVTQQITSLVSQSLSLPNSVALDGQGNIYLVDGNDNALKEWNAANQTLSALISSGVNGSFGVATDGQGNFYIAKTTISSILKLTSGYLSLPASVTEGSQAGTDSVTAQVLPASIPLTAASNQSWLTVTGVGGGLISFAFSANTSLSSRSAQITVLGQTVTITQSADVPSVITKTAGDGQSTAGGQVFSTPLQVNVADSNNIPLSGVAVTFTVTPGASGASGTFAASPSMPILTDSNGNAAAPALTANGIGGAFTVTASVNTSSAIFTLTNLVYSYLGASSATVGSTTGSGSVLLMAAGAWTASSNSSWLQIGPSSASGVGNALIQFTYSANPNAAVQTGTLTIAGLTFTVTQAGSGYVPVTLQTSLVSSGLNNPQGVAMDASGNVFIADTSDNAIKKWSAGTQQTGTLVSSGLNNPSAVAIDGSGNVYIADSGNHAIEEFGASSQQVTTLVSGLSNPYGVALDGQGNVYFSDTSNNAIDEWNAAMQQMTTLVGSGLSKPMGVAVDAQGNVYFADSGNNAIKEWAAPSGPVTVLVSLGLNNPTGVAVDGQDNVYLADTGNNAIKQWNPATQQVTSLASTGLNGPMGVAVDAQGNIYVADSGNSAIKKFTPAYLSLSTTNLNEPAQAGVDSVTAQTLPASIPLTATSNQSWLTVTGIAGGVISFSFSANTSIVGRSAQITVLGQTVTVTQSADVPFAITKTAGDGQSTLTGQAFPAPLQVTVTDSNGVALPGVPVTFTVMPGAGGASGSFNATPPMPILTNSSGAATAPTLTANGISGTFSAIASVTALNVTFTLTNMISGSLAASSVTVGNTAGSGSVLLLAAGSWTATSNASWLQLSAGSTSGTGNALVQFTYSANPNATTQTGTLNIGGLTYTVTQTGTSFTPIGVVTTLVSSGLSTPQGVAVDGSGNVYIGDTGNNAIKEWNFGTQQVSTLVPSGLNYPSGVAVDSQGNVYFADQKNNAVKKWSVATGTVTPLASSGLSSPVAVALDAQGNVYFSDAGHSAIKKWSNSTQQVTTLVSSGLNAPLGVAVDAASNVYFADQKNNAIKKWSVTTTLVSTLVSGLNAPFGVAVDGGGNVYFADAGNNAIKEWSPSSGQVTVLVSTGLKYPCGVAVDGLGNLYIADYGDSAIKKYTAVYLALSAASRNEGANAGTDSISFQVLPATTVLTATSNQSWLTITGTSGGAIGFSFTANTSLSSRSAQITVLGQTVTVTQSADVPAVITKTAGDGQSAVGGQAFATALQVHVADANGVALPGVGVTFAVSPGGSGASATFSATPPMPILTNSSGNATAPALTANSIGGAFAATASVNALSVAFALTNLVYNYLGASSVTVGNTAGSGSVLLLSTGTWTASSNASWLQLSAGNTSGTGNALIQFTYSANPNTSAQTGTLTIAGLTFTVTQAGTSYVPANLVTSLVSSGLSTPQGVAVDGSGNLYIADTANNAIKEWTASTQQVSALVSSGLNYPSGVAVDSQGNVYFADEKNNAIKKWSVATGTVTSLVSSGLSSPVGLALDAQGNIYFSDAGHNAIKKWSTGTQQVTTLVSTGLNLPLGVAVDAAGNVYFADQKNNAIKKWISATSLVSTLVSSGLNAPFGVAVDGGGNVYFADSGNNAIKQWSPSSGQVTALVSSGLKYPCGVAVDGQGNLYIADSNNSAIKKYTAVYLSLGAASRNEGAAAGTDSISFQVLPANNALTATSNQSWLTITGTSGGAIGFSFTANTSLSSRSAQITVLGQTVTVTQSADVPTTLTKSAGFNQSASKGQAFATALQVRATDAAGYGVQGVSVTFKVVPASNGSGGTFASSPTMPILTNASGYATAPVLTANSIAGTFSVTVTAGSLTATFTAIVTSN